MKKLGRIPAVILAVIIVNTAGLTLKYFGLTDYVILLGFRFHLGLAIPLLIYYLFAKETYIKKYFTGPELKNLWSILFIGLVPILMEVVLLLLSIAKIGDPLYFYEFGLTSIVDFPVYFIWNLPQLLLLTLFILNALEDKKNYSLAAVIFFALFLYQGVTFSKEITVNYQALVFLFSTAFLIWAGLAYFSSILEITSALFFIIWGAILINGSSSQVLINIFFAKNYSSWEGFLLWTGIPVWAILSAHIFICAALFLILRKKPQAGIQIDNNIKNEYNNSIDITAKDR
ncbi:MAG TPA: hypothetical protein VHO28_08800 [Ignavibacteriales bacterium]|nr:hypothetical protein [Ignavibacteriales bacterium]